MYQMITDAIQVLAVCFGVWVAWRGLTTWRSQLKGKNDYDLARRILIDMLRFRDALQSVRSPFMSGGEIADALKQHNLEDEHKEAQKKQISDISIGTRAAYAVRWDRVLEARRQLEAAIVEAEAIWDPKFKRACDPLWKLAAELYGAILRHQRLTEGRQRSPISEEASNRIDSILFDMSDPDSPDEFASRLAAAVEDLQVEIRQKL